MDPEVELEGFIAKYTDVVVARFRAARSVMRARLPGAVELVYDNYNALAIGYGPSERASEIVFSIAAFPRWISLFLVDGPHLAGPGTLLKGKVRHIVLESAARLDDPGVRDLMRQALARATIPLDPSQPGAACHQVDIGQTASASALTI